MCVCVCVCHIQSQKRPWRASLQCINVMRSKLMPVIFWHIDSHRASRSKMNYTPLRLWKHKLDIFQIILTAYMFVCGQSLSVLSSLSVHFFPPLSPSSWLWVGPAAGETEGDGAGDGEHRFQRPPQSWEVGVCLYWGIISSVGLLPLFSRQKRLVWFNHFLIC